MKLSTLALANQTDNLCFLNTILKFKKCSSKISSSLW